MTSATISTEKGDIDIDLFTTDAPKASQNFIDLAKKGFYDDVVFHRVISGFVIQAGDGEFGKKSALNRGRVGQGGPGYKFEDEPIKGDYGPRLPRRDRLGGGPQEPQRPCGDDESHDPRRVEPETSGWRAWTRLPR